MADNTCSCLPGTVLQRICNLENAIIPDGNFVTDAELATFQGEIQDEFDTLQTNVNLQLSLFETNVNNDLSGIQATVELQATAFWSNDAARPAIVPVKTGQIGLQTIDGSLWRSLSTTAGDWQEVQPNLPVSGRHIHNVTEFIAACAESGPLTLYLRAPVYITTLVTVPADKTVVFGLHRIVQGSAGTMLFYGTVVAERQHIFNGFTPGQIRGTFGRDCVFPEWWGLQTGRHDIAINSAVKSNLITSSNISVTVSLAARVYDVARPIDLAGSRVTLIGAGTAKTILSSTAAWDAGTWYQSETWDNPATALVNHAAMIWIGAEVAAHESYRTKVIGMDIQCGGASFAWKDTSPMKRVSGISAKGGVEENSLIRDVTIDSFTGFGVGFCRHKFTDNTYHAATVNGLKLEDFWLLGPTVHDAVAIHSTQWTNNWAIEYGTIDVGLPKSVSSAYNAVGGGDPTIYPPPVWMRDYPDIAIVAAGNLSLKSIYLEGSTIGIYVEPNSGSNNVVVTDVKCYAMQDRIRGAIYRLDGLSGAAPPANTAFLGYSCLVLISDPATSYNLKDCLTVNGITDLGSCCYLIRDAVYDVNRTMFDMGQFPSGAAGGRVAFYTRGNAYTGTGGGATYDPLSPSTDRTYFIGPIY